MNADEYATYKTLTGRANTASLGVVNLGGQERTLAYGYTVDRATWHTYVMAGELHVVLYRNYLSQSELLSHEHSEWLPADMLRPNKRVYPDTVDPLFARKMFEVGAELPLIGNFDFSSPDVLWRAVLGPFKGKTHRDF